MLCVLLNVHWGEVVLRTNRTVVDRHVEINVHRTKTRRLTYHTVEYNGLDRPDDDHALAHAQATTFRLHTMPQISNHARAGQTLRRRGVSTVEQESSQRRRAEHLRHPSRSHGVGVGGRKRAK